MHNSIAAAGGTVFSLLKTGDMHTAQVPSSPLFVIKTFVRHCRPIKFKGQVVATTEVPHREVTVCLFTAPDYTGPHRARTGPEMTDYLHFDDELKGVRRANYTQLTKEMNPSRRS